MAGAISFTSTNSGTFQVELSSRRYYSSTYTRGVYMKYYHVGVSRETCDAVNLEVLILFVLITNMGRMV